MTDMAPLRAEIDAIDRQIIALLGRRLGLVAEVVEVKARERLSVRIQARIDEVMENAVREAERQGVPQALVRRFWTELIEATCQAEERILGSEDC